MEKNAIAHYLIDCIEKAASLLKRGVRHHRSDDLHEFRIALRRVRSLATLFLTSHIPFPAELKSALKATNPIRELDVLTASVQKNKYPKTFRRLVRMRDRRAEKVIDSSYLRKTGRALCRYAEQLGRITPPPDEQTLIQTVEKYYQEALARHRAIDEHTPQKELHALRVAFKNSRYGLEFLSASGIPDEKEKIVLCKTLQNILGAVQDGYNQIDWLKKLARKHPCDETDTLLKKRKKKLRRLKAASRSALSHDAEDTRSSG